MIIVLVLFILILGFFIWIGKPVKGESFSFTSMGQNIKEFFVKTSLESIADKAEEIDNYKVVISSSDSDMEITYIMTEDKIKIVSPDMEGVESYYYMDEEVAYIYETSTKLATEVPYTDESTSDTPNDYWQNVDQDVKNLGFEMVDGKKCFVFETETDGEEITMYIWIEKSLVIRIKAGSDTMDFDYSKIGQIKDSDVTLPDDAQIQDFSSLESLYSLPEAITGQIPQ